LVLISYFELLLMLLHSFEVVGLGLGYSGV
jgi:hypothetical protein